jgi:hypothetical protein
VHAAPHLWRAAHVPEQVRVLHGVEALDSAIADYLAPIVDPPADVAPAPVVVVQPDIERVLRLGRRDRKPASDIVFVQPAKEYPSYSDLWRLASLAGFDVCRADEVGSDAKATYIVATPEAFTRPETEARVVWWNLEYTGDYVQSTPADVEAWSSDANDAKKRKATFVLLGSDARLGSEPAAAAYDLTLLGYMTPRRQALKDALVEFRWPVDYPGRDDDRDNVLRTTRLMLHVHQHETPAAAPLRFALAAAYRMPVLTEERATMTPLR